MPNFYDEFNATFWLSLATMILGSFGICLRYAYMSKCGHIRLCGGMIDIERNIEIESNIDIQHHGEEKNGPES